MSLLVALDERRKDLVKDIEKLVQIKRNSIDAANLSDEFVSSAIHHAAYGDSFAFFGHMRSVGDSIDEQFEHLDDGDLIKGADRRVQPYLRSLVFIAMIAEVEDFLSQMLTLVLRAYPQKLAERQVKVKDVIASDTIIVALDQFILAELNALFYEKPKAYRDRIEQILDAEPLVLEPVWASFIEMKARRDVGLHSSWLKNDVYVRKVKEGGGTVSSDTFLGISRQYFRDANTTATSLIMQLEAHCQSHFEPKPTPIP